MKIRNLKKLIAGYKLMSEKEPIIVFNPEEYCGLTGHEMRLNCEIKGSILGVDFVVDEKAPTTCVMSKAEYLEKKRRTVMNNANGWS